MAKRGRTRADKETRRETADAKVARDRARVLVRDVADARREELARVRRAADVWTLLAEPLAEARAEFERRTAKELHDDGIFEAEVHDELIAPVDARIDREREAEDRDAVREGDYRTARETPVERPPVKPTKPPSDEQRAPPSADDEVLAGQRSTGNIFIGIGLLAAVMMGGLALQYTSKERLARRVQTEFVAATCTIVDSRMVPGDGMEDHILRFERSVGGKTYASDRYSPDVVHGPGAHWMPVGSKHECFYDPKDPRTMFLYRGQVKGREELAWRYVIIFPLMFLAMGLRMRFAKTELGGD